MQESMQVLTIFTWINSMYRVYLKIDGKEVPVTWEKLIFQKKN